MSDHPPIVDANDKPITIGTRVRAGTEHVWTVTHISDCDGDVDDEGRAYGIPPYVEVALDGRPAPIFADSANTTAASFRTYWTAAGWWDEDAPYKTDDLEVAEDRGCAACEGDPEAHGLHVCGKEDFA